jgi:uncharacterized membrane protein
LNKPSEAERPHSGETSEYGGSLQHRAFEAGIGLKGLDGLLQALGGVLIWFVTPSLVGRFFQALYGHDFFRVEGGRVALHVLNVSENFASGSKLFPSVFLLSHGITKILLVTAIWMNKLWAYPLMIAVFSAFSIYQIYRLTHTHSLLLALITAVDIAIVILAWREYRHKLAVR